MSSDDGRETSASIEELIEQLSATERELQRRAAGELDAVVDRTSATAILLKSAQAAISQSEARFRDLINRCPALVCEVDREGRTIFANAAVRSILGFEAEDLVFFERVRAGYAARMSAQPQRFARIDSTLDKLAVRAQIESELEKRGW